MVSLSQEHEKPSQKLDMARSVLTPSIIAIASDGKIDEAEIVQLGNLIAFSPIFAGLDAATLDDMTNSIMDDLLNKGVENMIAGCVETLSPPLRQTAFCFAARVAMADGILDDRERDVLAEAADALMLPPGTFSQVLNVVAMMQRSAEA